MEGENRVPQILLDCPFTDQPSNGTKFQMRQVQCSLALVYFYSDRPREEPGFFFQVTNKASVPCSLLVLFNSRNAGILSGIKAEADKGWEKTAMDGYEKGLILEGFEGEQDSLTHSGEVGGIKTGTKPRYWKAKRSKKMRGWAENVSQVWDH